MPDAVDTMRDQGRALPLASRRLRLLSFNIQVGVRTGHYGHYVMRAWRHALPSRDMHYTLDCMAELMRDYDFVAVQEADAGSLRTRFVNQIEYLARRADFPYCGLTVTRDLHPVARHCLGFLSRQRPARSIEHRLPGRIRGRCAMQLEMNEELGGITFLIAHLSLGHQDRQHQLEYLSALVPASAPSVLIGDLNCEPEALRAHAGLGRSGLDLSLRSLPTFPSWRPVRSLDHILLSPQIDVHWMRTLPHAISDHLPLAAEISVAPRT